MTLKNNYPPKKLITVDKIESFPHGCGKKNVYNIWY